MPQPLGTHWQSFAVPGVQVVTSGGHVFTSASRGSQLREKIVPSTHPPSPPPVALRAHSRYQRHSLHVVRRSQSTWQVAIEPSRHPRTSPRSHTATHSSDGTKCPPPVPPSCPPPSEFTLPQAQETKARRTRVRRRARLSLPPTVTAIGRSSTCARVRPSGDHVPSRRGASWTSSRQSRPRRDHLRSRTSCCRTASSRP